MKKRSNIKPYQLLVILVVTFSTFSCSDTFFNEQAGDRITPDQSYNSKIDADVTLKGALYPLQNVLPKLIMLDGLRSDQMDVTPNADAYLVAINNQSFSSDNPYLDASDYYKVIINTNEALMNLDKVSKTDRNFDSYYLKYYKGALIGLRSWTYLNLSRLYGKAAYINGNLSSLPANMSQNILTKEVLLDTLIRQLTPYIHTDINLSELRIPNYMNSKAVLGEIYLEKGDYNNAVLYLQMACESYNNNPEMLKVDRAYSGLAWKNIFISAESQQSENISVIPFNQNEGQFNPLIDWMHPNIRYFVKPSKLLVDSFKVQIPLKGIPVGLYRGMGVTIDTTSSGAGVISKYLLDGGEPYSTDIVISRAADIHLLLAEALNRRAGKNDSKFAMILLNAGFTAELERPVEFGRWNNNQGIRGRASLMSRVLPDSINGAPITQAQTTDIVEDLIIDERALELAFEGKRWFDLVRVAKRRGPQYLADRIAAKFSDPAKAAEIHAKLMNQSNWYLPFK